MTNCLNQQDYHEIQFALLAVFTEEENRKKYILLKLLFCVTLVGEKKHIFNKYSVNTIKVHMFLFPLTRIFYSFSVQLLYKVVLILPTS